MLSKGAIPRVCLTCGAPFITHLATIKKGWGKYCSRPCYASSRRGENRGGHTRHEFSCVACDAPFSCKNRHRRFCSHRCYAAHLASVPMADRFWNKVDKSGECWLWTGARQSGGYGLFEGTTAHRIAWQLTSGPVPDGRFVCHDCPGGDNRLCVNPSHLWLGTCEENAHDMVAKGRAPLAKLTPDEVRQIRILIRGGADPTNVATTHGVHKDTINDIVTGATWDQLG